MPKTDRTHGTFVVHDNGKFKYLKLPKNWAKYLKDGEKLPASTHGTQLHIDLRKIIGQKINDSFKGPYYSEADMEKMFKKYGW